jgi:predicted NAD/FAD-dependent oxidoreductase
VEAPLGEAFLLDRGAGVGFCGDWCLGARAEAAWLSGTALGSALAAAREETGSGKIRGSR